MAKNFSLIKAKADVLEDIISELDNKAEYYQEMKKKNSEKLEELKDLDEKNWEIKQTKIDIQYDINHIEAVKMVKEYVEAYKF